MFIRSCVSFVSLKTAKRPRFIKETALFLVYCVLASTFCVTLERIEKENLCTEMKLSSRGIFISTSDLLLFVVAELKGTYLQKPDS